MAGAAAEQPLLLCTRGQQQHVQQHPLKSQNPRPHQRHGSHCRRISSNDSVGSSQAWERNGVALGCCSPHHPRIVLMHHL
eukprot:351774-Chlamydomonas_euryale.AAC.5